MRATRHQTILQGKVKGQRNRRRPKRYWEKDVDDWMGASVWRVERTVEDTSRQKRPETDNRKSVVRAIGRQSRQNVASSL